MDNTPPTDIDEKWELETQPDVREFVREQVESGKGRQSIFEHHGPVLRGLWNPVQKAFRTAALVRGNHPYVLMVDDIRKDDSSHLYEWAMHLPPDLEIIRSGGNWVDLGAREIPADPKSRGTSPNRIRGAFSSRFSMPTMIPPLTEWLSASTSHRSATGPSIKEHFTSVS